MTYVGYSYSGKKKEKENSMGEIDREVFAEEETIDGLNELIQECLILVRNVNSLEENIFGWEGTAGTEDELTSKIESKPTAKRAVEKLVQNNLKSVRLANENIRKIERFIHPLTRL